jgi:outer membrane protein assembly factor BamB
MPWPVQAPKMDQIAVKQTSPAQVKRRLLLAGTGLGLVSGVSGCGVFSSSKAKLSELPNIGSNRLGVVWRNAVAGAGFGFQPGYATNSVWLAAKDGTVSRLEASTGKLEWSIKTGTPLVAGVGADGEIVVVASRDGRLLAFDGQGKSKWVHAIGTEASSIPTVAVGIVVARTSDNKTIGIDSETGRRRWTFSRQNAPVVIRQTSAVAIDGGSAFVGLPGGRLVALSLQNGSVRWEAPVSNPRGATEIERIADVLGSPLIAGRDVCAASYQGRVSCFEVASGRPLWSREWSAVGGIELDARNVYACDARGYVTCLSRSDRGNPVWTQDLLKGRELTAPILLGSSVITADQSGLIHAFNASDGSPVGRLSTDGSAIVSAGVNAGGMAVFQTSAGGVYAVSAS